MEGKKRPAWEWLVFVVVIGVAVWLVGGTLNSEQKLTQQTNLHYQLEALRTAEVLFKSVNRTNPQTLNQIIEGTFTLPNDRQSRKYVEIPFKMASGKALDPFGNPYVYEKGWIKSTTPGYEGW